MASPSWISTSMDGKAIRGRSVIPEKARTVNKTRIIVGTLALCLAAIGAVVVSATGCGGVLGSGGCPGAVIVSCTEPCPIDCEAQDKTTTCVGPDYFDDADFGDTERCCFCQ